jgi:hypothetical protein
VSPGENVTISFAQVAGATSYEIALVGPESQALWSPVYRETNGNQATVNLAGALAMRPYRIAVRAKGAAGKSPEAFSETIVVEDRNAPTLKANATAQGKSIGMSMVMADDLALDHWIVWMSDASQTDAPHLVAGESLVDGVASEMKPVLVVPSELRGKNVAVRVDVLDTAGNAAKATFNATIDKNGFVVALAEGDAAVADEPVSFGGCRAAGNGPANTGAALLLGFALTLVRRARRRAR